MANQTNSAGDPRGTIPATAGSDKPQGDRLCSGETVTIKCGQSIGKTNIDFVFPGTGVEPGGEERTSSSALVPPAPSQMLAGADLASVIGLGIVADVETFVREETERQRLAKSEGGTNDQAVPRAQPQP